MLNQIKNGNSFNEIEEIKARSNNVDIISFDVFDTLITRLVDSPADIFTIVESELFSVYGNVADGFAKARENAEAMARNIAWQEGREEVNFNDIYNCIKTNFKEYINVVSHAAEIELSVEKENIIAVGEIKSLLDDIYDDNKTIIFVSDMYHSSQFIGELLEKCGYQINYKLFVSSEVGYSKSTGRIWGEIIAEFGNRRFLHIGDDLSSDVLSPRKYGIQTIEFTPYRSERRSSDRLDRNLAPFSKLKRLNNLSNIHLPVVEWRKQGQVLGAIIVQSFINWLKIRVEENDIKHVYFCARDGYLIKKAWDLLELDNDLKISSSYLYVSRKPLNFSTGYLDSTAGKLDAAFCDFLAVTYRPITFQELLVRLQIDLTEEIISDAVQTFGSLHESYDDWLDRGKFIDFIQRHSSAIYKRSKKIYTDTVCYFQQQGLFEQVNAAIVDLGWSGTLQVGINKVITSMGENNKVSGFYYGLNNSATGNRYLAGWMEAAFGSDFIDFDSQFYLRNAVDILETLHSAPHGSVSGYEKIDGKWIPTCNWNKVEEDQFTQIISPYQNGVMDTLTEWKNGGKIAGINASDITTEVAISAMDAVFCSPSEKELELYGSIMSCPSFQHDNYRGLLDVPMPVECENIKRALQSAAWPIGLAKKWMEQLPSEAQCCVLDYLRLKLSERCVRQFE